MLYKDDPAAYHREWYAKNPDKARKLSEKSFGTFYCTLKGRATHMLNNARSRAKRKGYEFDLDHDFILQKLSKGVCEVTGLPFVFKLNGGKGHKTNSFSPSLERKDNSKGYTKDNVQIVCWIYNRAKGAFPLEDLILMVKALTTANSQQIPFYPS
jgi:hypothetical protein